MGIVELFLIAVGLSMDAFAVSVCKGLAMERCTWRRACMVGAYFGFFQALMPTAGYILGVQFKNAITSIDHWIAFALLVLIGANMIREALGEEEECECSEEDAALDVRTMLGLSVATSIDALAVGVTFAFLQVAIVPSVCFIGATTFVISVVGVKVGNVFGSRYRKRAEIIGGVILVFLGVKILIEHLGADMIE